MTAVLLPFVVVAVAIPLLWGHLLGWSDVAVFALMYLLSGFGVTVGFHRMLTHRSFQTHPFTRYLFAILGSFSVQGPVIDWVADHRKHHAHTDQEGDPHSPHVGHGSGVSGALRGLWHAHVGWLWRTHGEARSSQYAKELVEDRGMRVINRRFPQIALASLAIPALLGFALTQTLHGALTGLIWGGLRAHLSAAPRHVERQFRLPFLRKAALRRRGSLDQRLLARAALVRRVLAPQSPRLPTLRRAWPALVGTRSVGGFDRAHAPHRTRLGRRPHHTRTSGG